MLTIEGSTSYCDSAGNLLFYSNGGGRLPSSGQSTGRIWNRNNDSFGCRAADTLIVEVDIRCSEVVVPTIFSPNGTGPQANETFCIFSDCVEQFKLLIFNRWGEKIFESEDISQCWDGTFKGIEAATGSYGFNLYIKRADETNVSKSGTISLVR